MVTFIPPFIGEDVKSNAEKKIFEVLQDLKLEDAYILHSLGLPRHQNKMYGEIDFVIVCRRGVARLEIKGGRVECINGEWHFTDRYGVDKVKAEGPYAQVLGNMFSLLANIKSHFDKNEHIKFILVSCGVMFPDIEFNAATEECIPEITFDNRTGDITKYINGIFDYWERRRGREANKLSRNDIKDIVDYLRGDFSFIPTLNSRLNDTDKRLLRLTKEQAQIMNALSLNNHLLIEGGAGTGKTLLAVDFAKRKAAEGNKVLYLTFNKNLANSVNEQVVPDDNLKIINIHALFGEYIPVSVEKIEQDAGEYFYNVLPEEFLDHISGLHNSELDEIQYDLLIMDEGQDIIRPLYLYSLDVLLKNGLKDGNWAIFFDERQNIYNPEYEDGMDIISGYSATRFKLFLNCRNTIQIGTYSSKVSGIDVGDFLKENGEEVQKISYSDSGDFKTQTKNIMKMLRDEDIDVSDVVFLSPKKLSNSMLRDAGIKVNELGDNYDSKSKLPKFSTIQGFKGLDSKIVILVDVDSIHTENFSRFIYIAGTRARTLLYIIASEEYWQAHKI